MAFIIHLIIIVAIIGLCLWAVRELARAFSLPPPVGVVLTVVVVLLGCLYLLSLVGPMPARIWP